MICRDIGRGSIDRSECSAVIGWDGTHRRPAGTFGGLSNAALGAREAAAGPFDRSTGTGGHAGPLVEFERKKTESTPGWERAHKSARACKVGSASRTSSEEKCAGGPDPARRPSARTERWRGQFKHGPAGAFLDAACGSQIAALLGFDGGYQGLSCLTKSVFTPDSGRGKRKGVYRVCVFVKSSRMSNRWPTSERAG